MTNNTTANIFGVLKDNSEFNSAINLKAEQVTDDNETSDTTKIEDFCDSSIDSRYNKNILFISLDICGSTALKIKFQETWINMVNILLSNKPSNVTFWKFNGDEVLYYEEVNTLNYLVKIIKEVNSKVDTIQHQLKTEFKENIYIRTTIWIARVNCFEATFKAQSPNVIKNFELIYDELKDYVGVNMDEGFRLCSHASPRKILMDPKLVYLLLMSKIESFDIDARTVETYNNDIDDILNHIYFYDFVKCKDIWKNRKYPMYWYVPKEKEKCIHYDECLDIDSLKSISDDENSAYELLHRIFDNVEVLDDVEELVATFKNNVISDIHKQTETVANLYYMVACVNPKTGNVLIGQRSDKRIHLKGVWDFGNVKFQKCNMPEFIKMKYREFFNIDINLSVNAGRDGNIVPYQTCKVYRNCNPHNGILCHAVINSPVEKSDQELADDINEYLNSGEGNCQYTQVRFISLDDVEKIEDHQILTIDEIRDDSELAKRGYDNSSSTDGKYLMYIKDSVHSANEFYKKNLCDK